MFRVHQFNKVEMFVFIDAADAWDEHDRMVAVEESLLQQLGLPYRVVNVAAGDLGAPAAKKIDMEAWFPSQERYREVTSCSNTTDFQARRLGIREPAARRARDAAHAQRHRRHRSLAAGDARELPGRRAGVLPDPVRRSLEGHRFRLGTRRGARAVESGGLENRWACKRPVGSNPTPAATIASTARIHAPCSAVGTWTSTVANA